MSLSKRRLTPGAFFMSRCVAANIVDFQWLSGSLGKSPRHECNMDQARDQTPGNEDAPVPHGFMRLSAAVNLLASKMWGGLKRPMPLAHIRESFRELAKPAGKEVSVVKKLVGEELSVGKELSVGWGPWREQSGRRLRKAATQSELTVFVIAVAGADPVPVPATILERLIPSRRGLSDRQATVALKAVRAGGGNERLYALLRDGVLLVRENDFRVWCESEKCKGKWPSQGKKKRRKGRPSRQSDDLRNAISARVNDERWDGRMGIPSLHAMLTGSAGFAVPSEDTLRRLVNRVFAETGDARFRIPTRRRRLLPQN
jgi:hypothetical protein